MPYLCKKSTRAQTQKKKKTLLRTSFAQYHVILESSVYPCSTAAMPHHHPITANFGYNDIGYNNISLITTLISCPELSPFTATQIPSV